MNRNGNDTTENAETPDATPRAETTPIAVIGIGCMFPGAESASAYWANIKDRVDSITDVPPTHWRPDDYFDPDPKAPDRVYARRGGFLSPVEFNPLELGISPHTLEATDSTQLLGLVVAREALRDSGYLGDRPFDRSRVSVILGVTGTLELVIPLGARLGHPLWRKALAEAGVDARTADDVVERISAGYVPWQECSFPGLLGNVAAGRIANRLDLGGTNCVVDAACASSLGAIHLAALELSTGRCDVAVSGGLDTFNDIFMYMCFSKTPALSPSGHARPFDAAGDGTTLGEGLGVVVLKRLEDARRDGDRIYAVIRAIGASSDGKGNAIYAPSSSGQARALRSAYSLAGVSPETIELVEAHGTGTRVGDATEVTALSEVYRAVKPDGTWCALGSVKSQIGHTKAAAGVAGLIKAILALHAKVLPPTIKVERPVEPAAPGKSPFYINTEKRPWLSRPDHPRRAAVSAFGFGGSNFHCVLEESERQKAAPDWDGGVQIIALGADSIASLESALHALPIDETAKSWHALRAAAARSRQEFVPGCPCRLLLVVERGRTDLKKLAGSAALLLKQAGVRSNATSPDGAYLGCAPPGGSSPRDGKLAFLFPGQGSQYTGMLRDIVCQFPEALLALEEAEECFAISARHEPGRSLAERIFPIPAFTDEARARAEALLRDTETAQPALGAVSLACLRTLTSFGVEADVTAGHSFGELTALAGAGWIDAPSLHFLARLRGRLMAQDGAADPDRDRGAMAAVAAPLADVERWIREEPGSAPGALVLANRNAPEQAVVSGPSKCVDDFCRRLEARGVSVKRLPVSAAFHSPLVAPASRPFGDALRTVVFAPGSVPVYSNTTGKPYPEDPEAARSLLAGQLAKPVEFAEEVRQLHAAGVRAFLEVGPSNKLTGLVSAILRDRDHQAIAVDSSSGKGSGILDLARALAQLAALGHAVDLRRWDAGYDPASAPPAARPGVTIPLTGANYVKPRASKPPSESAAPTSPAPAVAPSGVPPSAPMLSAPAVPRALAAELRPEPRPFVPPAPPTPSRSAPVPASTRAAAAPTRPLPPAEELEGIDSTLAALIRMQRETADLHRRFLDGQEAAQRSIQSLIESQLRRNGAAESEARPAAALAPVPAVVQPAGNPPVVSVPASASVPVEPSRAPTGASRAASPAPAMADRPASRDTGPAASAVLTVVAEKTGYPAEMLSLDMSLDSDLGIDSIKRVEIFSALRERLPGAPEVTPADLPSLGTLRAIADFLGARETDPVAEELPPAHTGPSSGDLSAPAAAALLTVVAEKTGYPAEMLSLDMSLDSDLGIDSIKRVEIFSALRERLPGAPEVTPADLPSLGTLRAIADFLGARETDPVAEELPPAHTGPSSGDLSAPAAAALLAVVAEKTGYPAEMLSLDMSLDSDLGIDSIKRVEIFSALRERLPGAPEVTPADLPSLGTLRAIATFLGSRETGPVVRTVPEPAPVASEAAANGAIVPTRETEEPVRLERLVLQVGPPGAGAGLTLALPPGANIWIAGEADDLARSIAAALRDRGCAVTTGPLEKLRAEPVPERLHGLVLISPASSVEPPAAIVWRELEALQRLGTALRAGPRAAPAFLAGITRRDGAQDAGARTNRSRPELGALSGLVKTAAHEWPGVRAKVIDLVPGFGESAREAEEVVAELLRDGSLEVVMSRSGAQRIDTSPQAISPGSSTSRPIAPGDLVIMTGGARGVTAEAAVALAESWQASLLLLGRAPAFAMEPPWLAQLDDEAALKQTIIDRSQGRATPRAIGDELRRILAAREQRRTLSRIEAAGSRVLYRSVDVRDAASVCAAVAEARRTLGPVRGVIHGAGVLADRRIEEKTREQFDEVFSTKVEGLQALLDATSSDELRFLAIYSSSTARFGRVGQVDYAAANEALNKMAQSEARRRPGCRVVSLNWGPWEGGMVTPGLRKVFEKEGVGLIPLREGARHLLAELSLPAGSPVEVVVLGPAPIGDAAGGAESAPVTHTGASTATEPQSGPGSSSFALEISVGSIPLLRSHVMNGKAVVPAALIIEWLAHGALHGSPGLVFQGFDDFKIFKGLILGPDDCVKARVTARRIEQDESTERCLVELWSDGTERPRLHARAVILLGAVRPPAPPPAEGLLLAHYAELDNPYDGQRLFHGEALQAIERVEGLSEEGIAAFARTSPAPGAWIRQPLRGAWLSDPLALDAAFQLLILWSFATRSAGSLPSGVATYRQFQKAFPRDGARILVRVTNAGSQTAAASIDFRSRTGELIARIEGCEFVIDESLEAAFARNRLEEAEAV